MTALDRWLQEATRQLSHDSAAQVRREIQEHYESAREIAVNSGLTAEEADRSAVSALGEARTANCQYRHVLLTKSEARLLREGNWEARAVCSRSWLKWAMLALPVAVLMGATVSLLRGSVALAQSLLVVGMGMGLLLAGPLLPVYTPSRSRIFRFVKWLVFLAILGFGFGLESPWLLIACLWPIAWIERTRFSIRRKLPVAEWPKQLYL
jgi:hypothetical protein